jgi:peptidoglycan-N-acetylglucosamine deacetylase
MGPLAPLAAAIAVGGAAWLGWAAAWPSAQVWGRGYHRGPRQGRALALTFDDGPSNETERFLDLLAEHGAQATFFVCGRNVERRPETARRIVAAGFEIANHTFSHTLLPTLPPRQIREEVERAQRAIEDATGVAPRLFRPPYGVRAPGLREALGLEGLTSVHWTTIGNDWKWGAERIAARVLRGAEPGAIVCLHDGDRAHAVADRRETLAALRVVLPALVERGFRLVTAGEMAPDGTLRAGGARALQ